MHFKIFFDFMKWRKLWYAISLVAIIPGLVAFGVYTARGTGGLNYGIDFTGGNLLQVQLQQSVTMDQVRRVVDRQGIGSYGLQSSGPGQYLMRTRELTEAENDQLIDALRSNFGNAQVLRNEKVGAVIGNELRNKAILALLIGSFLMLIYITVRFRWSFAVAAVLALIHDLLLTVGLFALFRIEVDSTFVAAILTIIGYSINDTIVIFDRIRESLKVMRKESLMDIINYSINISLVRSLTTGFTVIMALVALLVLGGQTTRVFALTLLIGTLTGCYSSVCVASPLYFELEQRWGDKHRREARLRAQAR